VNHNDAYLEHRVNAVPLPRAICQLLYAFCKVRGYKVIVRLLNNEPKYIEPLINCFHSWSTFEDAAAMTWEERYIMLLWLSHLMLAPFSLSSISTAKLAAETVPTTLCQDLPSVATNLLGLALKHVYASSKAREAASILLIRLALRGDMQACELPMRLIEHCLSSLKAAHSNSGATIYEHLGNLSILYGLLNSGSDSEVSPFLQRIFDSCIAIAASEGAEYASVRDSAPARKLLIKIVRAGMLHALSLGLTREKPNEHEVESMLENGIQDFLDALADKDTPVRMAASKALSVTALRLDSAMSAQIAEAVLDSLNENVLLEEDTNGNRSLRNLSAVNPLKWHGLMLTLAHLLFRRSPPPEQLPAIIESLLSGLEFAQRSNVGTSVGVAVRDAACFGLWSLARKYTAAEIQAVDLKSSSTTTASEGSSHLHSSTLQVIATRLVASACLDSSGNLRRGCSAALQELIGRHPDTIKAGIPLVQTIDYHAVARRSRAMVEVASEAAVLDRGYHQALIDNLLGWRGAKAVDAESRRFAATSTRELVSRLDAKDIVPLVTLIRGQLESLKAENIGSSASSRHGLMLCLASVVDVCRKTENSELCRILWETLSDFQALTGDLDGRLTTDSEYVLEATSSLIAALAKVAATLRTTMNFESRTTDSLSTWTEKAVAISDKCTTATENETVVHCSAYATRALFQLMVDKQRIWLLESWLDAQRQKRSYYYCKGRIATLGYLFHSLPAAGATSHFRSSILLYVEGIITAPTAIETKVNAMDSLGIVLPALAGFDEDHIATIQRLLAIGLTDYTIDERGDIGSVLRLQSIKAAETFWVHCPKRASRDSGFQPVVGQIARLAAERLNKVRFRAWQFLETLWSKADEWPKMASSFRHLADVSSLAYYQQIVKLLEVNTLREQVLVGLISSATTGTDEVGRAACDALVLHILVDDKKQQADSAPAILTCLTQHVAAVALKGDRELVPALELLSLLLEQGILTANMDIGVWDVLQKVHTTSPSIARFEALTKVYGALTLDGNYRVEALDKLTRLLLHRWPKIRGMAADVLFMHTSADTLASCNWNASVAENKPAVLGLRKILGVAGSGVATVKSQ